MSTRPLFCRFFNGFLNQFLIMSPDRTNADKRNAMEIAWANREEIFGGKTPSSRQLASVCGISKSNAATFLQKLQVSNLDTPTGRVTRPCVTAFDSTTTLSLDRECVSPTEGARRGGYAGCGEGTAVPTIPTALTTTHDHLEERNETVQRLWLPDQAPVQARTKGIQGGGKVKK